MEPTVVPVRVTSPLAGLTSCGHMAGGGTAVWRERERGGGGVVSSLGAVVPSATGRFDPLYGIYIKQMKLWCDIITVRVEGWSRLLYKKRARISKSRD